MVPGSGRQRLIDAINAVDPQPNSVVVGELFVARERLEARVGEALSGFLARGLHQVEGWSSPVGWLKAQGLSDVDAKRLDVRGARLAAWPALARSWFDGELSGAQVEVVVNSIPKSLVDLYGTHDAEVSPFLVGLSLVDTTRAIRGWVVRFFCDHYAEFGSRPGRQHPQVAVTIDPDDRIAGSLRGLGIISAENLSRFLAARPMGIFEEGLCRDALAHAAGTPVDHDRHPLRAASLATLFTEGTLLHRLLIAEGQVIDRGRNVRLASPNLRDAMVARDRGCRFPKCDAPTAWVHAHHLSHWEAGGATDLANLAGLCAAHHGVVHRRGWALELEPDGTLVFRRPDGHTVTSAPPRRHRPPLLPLYHPRLRGVIPELPDRAPPDNGAVDPGTEPHPSMVDHGESTDQDTALMVRARVVELVHRRHRRRPPPAPGTWAWPDAG